METEERGNEAEFVGRVWRVRTIEEVWLRAGG